VRCVDVVMRTRPWWKGSDRALAKEEMGSTERGDHHGSVMDSQLRWRSRGIWKMVVVGGRERELEMERKRR